MAISPTTRQYNNYTPNPSAEPLFELFSPTTSMTPPSRTPCCNTIEFLVRGNLPTELAGSLQTTWANPAASPCTPRTPEIPNKAIWIKPLGSGKSCPYTVSILPNRTFSAFGSEYPADQKKEENQGAPVAVIKLRQTEEGCPRWKEVHKEIPFPRRGCPPGSGAFVELVVGIYAGNLLKSLPELSPYCVIPQIAYAHMGHPAFSSEHTKSPSSIRGSGVIAKYISECTPITDEDRFHPLALELMAFIDIALLNNDRTKCNALKKVIPENKNPALVLIDHAYSLSQGGIDGGKFYWKNHPVLQESPSPRIQEFIHTVDENILEKLAEELSLELSQNLEKIPTPLRHGEKQMLGIDRILPHKIALCFIKAAIQKNWSLSQIGYTLLHIHYARNKGEVSRECLAHEIYQTLTTLELEPAVFNAKMQELCLEAIAKGPRKDC